MTKFFFLLFALFAASARAQDAAPSETGSAVSKAEADALVAFHNKARKEVGVAAIEWSAELAAYAQQWADYLAKQGCKLQHRPYKGKYAQQHGENIFWGSGSSYGTIDAAKEWYKEKKKFKGGASWMRGAGHYSQMVWRKSTKLGCGVARCPNGAIIVVGNYDPAGNMVGQKPY